MKQRSTTPASKTFVSQASLVAVTVMVAAATFIQAGSAVFARDYDAEIRAAQQESEQYSAEASRLHALAGTLQEALDQLNGQIAGIQAQIAESQKKHAELVQKIEDTNRLIEKNREALGEILADIYVDDQISPLEMLASSDNIGDFIDKQAQRATLRQGLNDRIKEIKELQKKLEEDKKSVENVLKDQESQQAQLASKQAEQQQLITETRNDQSVYSGLAAERNAQVGQLQQQQLKSNCEAFGGIWQGGTCAQPVRSSGGTSGGGGVIPAPSSGNGGYPAQWANAPRGAYVDNWGLYTRECVSYVAWKVANSGRYVPHFAGAGHAYQWPSTLARHGIAQGSTPKAGAAAVMYGGPYGHVMYVESVNGDGTITVSDYNLGVDGLYRYYTRSASGLVYIYF